MRTIKRIHPARYCSIDDLITYSPLPTPEIHHIDPFLALNHLGPQRYIPENNGLPFYPHSIKDINIVSIVLEGETVFEDSNENKTLVKAGGFHWLNAGKGLKLYEGSSPEFTEKGGKLEVLQLWINHPTGSRNRKPAHLAIQKDKIPLINKEEGNVSCSILTGKFDNTSGAVNSHDTTTVLVSLAPDARVGLSIPADRNILFYIIRGSVVVNGQKVNKRNLVEFDNNEDLVDVRAEKESQLLLAHARPVGNRHDHAGTNLLRIREYQQMCRDFYRGRMGLT